jgi:hypothetical protein
MLLAWDNGNRLMENEAGRYLRSDGGKRSGKGEIDVVTKGRGFWYPTGVPGRY